MEFKFLTCWETFLIKYLGWTLTKMKHGLTQDKLCLFFVVFLKHCQLVKLFRYTERYSVRKGLIYQWQTKMPWKHFGTIILEADNKHLNTCDQKPALCLHVKIKYLLRAHLRIILRNRHKRHGIILAFIPPLTAESAVTAVSRFSWCLTQSDCVGQTKTLRRLLRLRLHTEISSSLFISPLFVPEET